jgi:Predicted pyridoxal phosphate-dependent enzyme apparently involved in regulation of cell wall biogenesis
LAFKILTNPSSLDSVDVATITVFPVLAALFAASTTIGIPPIWGQLHYIPVHKPYYQVMEFPESEQYYQEAISLPMFSAMTNEQQVVVTNTITEILK